MPPVVAHNNVVFLATHCKPELSLFGRKKLLDHATLTTVMRRLAIEAGAAIMEIYGEDDFDVRAKDDESPVTAADEAADALISAGLRAAFPDMALVTEEQAASHEQEVSTF